MKYETSSAAEIAAAVLAKKTSAGEVVAAALKRIESIDKTTNAFTDVLAARAHETAARIDKRVAHSDRLPLAGVPFAVKNLFDVRGIPTRAGSKINREREPARLDSPLIERLEAQGAVLVGALNMGEYAYDFTGENAHDGAARNPHNPDYMTGGSSSGSGGAVAAGLVPLTLGSDTNGSIRVPSSFCGLFGLKPTYGRLSRARSFPFVGSLDHLGPLARSAMDLALSYDAMQGPDREDPVCAQRPVEPAAGELAQGIKGLRIAKLGGYFAKMGEADAFAAADKVAQALSATETVELKDATVARASAYLITAAEGAALHLPRLRERAADFDPDVRDRLLGGALIPAAWTIHAQKVRRHFQAQVREMFERYDLLIAPATPTRAPKIGQKKFTLDGQELLVRPNIGLYTQPISFVGLPVAAVPVWLDDGLPIGVQIIAPPWREDLALRAAYALERSGVCVSKVATP
ncbi:MAG: AtzE family amidohydrolase [Xanthobacteraceae bacterium]|nr:AtzE family amidohydrolase [Xanthobacteraceae bacterium]QYK46270.1 MAG: AtzE family amidohydrolase [Xanthobacteraceae bacterium]